MSKSVKIENLSEELYMNVVGTFVCDETSGLDLYSMVEWAEPCEETFGRYELVAEDVEFVSDASEVDAYGEVLDTETNTRYSVHFSCKVKYESTDGETVSLCAEELVSAENIEVCILAE